MVSTKNVLALVLALLCISSAGNAQRRVVPDKEKSLLVGRLLEVNDGIIDAEMRRQLMGDATLYGGALLDVDSVVSPIQTAQFIQTLMCGYVSPASRHYKSKEVLLRMTKAAQALVNLQHDDGTIDLVTTNFHSTPDLGFTIFPVGVAYSIMLQNPKMEFAELAAPLKQYLTKAGDALSVGGIHTPNHRWVVSAALAWVHSFFKDPKYEARIGQWLAEGVDIDPDGQYNERSTSVYTPVTNRCLIDIARKMKYDHLYEIVRKNLDMTFYLVHANGEVVTETSRRRDKYLRADMSKYYLAYNHMAIQDNSGRYSGMVKQISESVPAENLVYMLPMFIEDASLLRALPAPSAPPTSYHKRFEHSDLVRIRDGNVDMSIVTDNSTFFTFFKGDAALEAVRLSSAFFGKGQFASQSMSVEGSTYVMSMSLEGPYYQPLPPEMIPKDADAWATVPRHLRATSEVQHLMTRISITPEHARARVKIVVEGPTNLPVTLELGFRKGGTFENVVNKQGVDHAFLAKNGKQVVYKNGDDTIRVGPASIAHKWTQLRGALPKLDADCVYFTGYAPCTFEFVVE